MKVIDYLEKANRTLFSYEIIPPVRGGNIREVFQLIEELMPYEPPFIDLTSRSAEISYEERADGMLKRVVKRKRPGTIGLSAAIKNRYNVETVPHLLCNGFTKQETEDALIELNYLGINNVLAIRGDDLRKPSLTEGKTLNNYAVDLIRQIGRMNHGEYLEDLYDANPTDFCIGAAGYPEKHFEAPNIATDIRYLKAKVDAGAEYIVTQMCFDTQNYIRFVERCREAGISIPIVPGIKIITRKNHLVNIPKNFYVDIPDQLAQKIQDAPSSEVPGIGIAWALEQCQELVNFGVPCIHFYIMSSAREVATVVKQLK